MIEKPIKVLLTIPNFHTAGSGKVVYDLAKGLDKTVFDVHIACSHKKGDFFKVIESLGLPIHSIETTCQLRPYFSLVNRLRPFKNFVKQHNFDIVHSWNWSSDWTEVVATRWAGAKFIYTKKAMSWGNKHWRIKSYLSNFIVTLNEDMDAFFSYKKNKKLIPLGIDTEIYKPQYKGPQKHGIFKIITVANLVAVKNIEVLIDAINLIEDASISLSIVGDDNTAYASGLKKKIIGLGLEKQVEFLGKHIDVKPFLQDSDLYVIPSYSEGMPMALVEAMSMGIPVLGSNVSGVKYVLKNFQNLLYDQQSPLKLSLKIREIMRMDKAEREKMGERLRTAIVCNFSLQKFIERHTELYKSIL